MEALMRSKVYFVPSYIGSLKYLLRVATPLQNRYDIGFLIIHPNSNLREQMITFCKEKGLTFSVITDELEVSQQVTVPFYVPLRKRYVHSKRCREFLQAERPLKIVVTKTKYPHDTIVKEANRLGVETTLLQWSYYNRRYTPAYISVHQEGLFSTSSRDLAYQIILKAITFFLDIPFKEARYAHTYGNPRKVGVFDETEAKYRAKFFDPSIIRVIGAVDFQIVHELKEKIDSDVFFRKELLKKYNLSPEKQKIVVVLSRYYLGKKDGHGLEGEEHIIFHYDVFKTIRSVFAPNEAELIFKLHPAEENVYESYKELGVNIYDDEANIDELLCLSDLYIADPATNVNYMALASNISAIFMNFYPIKSPEEHLKHYHISDTALDMASFSQRLQQFKGGILPKQYDNSQVNTHSLDAAVELIG